MKIYLLLNFFLKVLKSNYNCYLRFLLGFFLLLNWPKVQAQTVPLDYNIHQDEISNPVTPNDETINNQPQDSAENLEQNSPENDNEPIMIFVPPPESNGQINVSPPRKTLADLLVIQEMIIP